MWARVVECMLGCWLAVSPFVFGHAPENLALWATDWTAAALITIFALLSYWKPARHIHLASALAACWLIAYGRFAAADPPPALQNHIVVGLLLLMFALVPNHASRPPQNWNAQPAE